MLLASLRLVKPSVVTFVRDRPNHEDREAHEGSTSKSFVVFEGFVVRVG
jgi:hypothetical protein